ncbi:baseplate assembly protein [Salmonella enterica subsp. enterica serovar Oslo]|nr:baseplate assembly protein [Salmonella enterica subsp. enterica serovar Oslo]EBY9022673.1 baseplate assembly protein [Salmonella enterica subsp. enterica serovar Oslo]EEB8309415.1 baseplate assembly protein [Salmonella enterica subsp. enterica serovar Oslo]
MTLYSGMNNTSGKDITDIDHLRQSVRDILLTPQGSRIARREYGSLLSALIDQPQNPALRLQVMSAVYVALSRWEPRLTLDSITINSNFDGSMVVELTGRRNNGVPDFETLLAERKAEFVALHPKDEQEAVIRTLELESEPVTKLLQENAYRELLLRQRINEAAQAVMVAYAMGGDLDQIAANYNVKRLTVTPADNNAVPPVAAVMESDEALRLRVPAAFEGLSVAGPTAAYEFHARSADGRVADASATSPAPAEVVLTVLSREGDGTAEKDLLDVVEKALNSENVRPVADRLTVRSAEIIPYRVEATIFLYPGPEAEPVMAAAKASLQRYIASQTRLGRDIRRSAIFAALHVEGVQRVELASPQADVVLNKTQAASCTQWSVTNGGTDE